MLLGRSRKWPGHLWKAVRYPLKLNSSVPVYSDSMLTSLSPMEQRTLVYLIYVAQLCSQWTNTASKIRSHDAMSL